MPTTKPIATQAAAADSFASIGSFAKAPPWPETGDVPTTFKNVAKSSGCTAELNISPDVCVG